jgi:hypothetical protein
LAIDTVSPHQTVHLDTLRVSALFDALDIRQGESRTVTATAEGYPRPIHIQDLSW